MPVKLVEIIRGNTVESTHRGDIAVVNNKGEIIYELGNSERLTFMRSASKPFQAITALETGIAEVFRLDLKEIALITSSHSGEKEHIQVLKSIMDKVGLKEEYLLCGSHEPISKDAAAELINLGINPSKLHCNCSAKHVGLLAACKLRSYSTDDYIFEDHPIQGEIDRIISDFSETPVSEIIKGIDGCNIPVHAIPLKSIARAYANLTNFEYMSGKYKKSQEYITDSMTAYPEMVAGEGRLDTEIMKLLKKKIVAKIGAEGVYCASIIGKNIGVAIKIDDGNSRAVGPVILEVLFQLKIISEEEIKMLKDFWNPGILNHYGVKVGEIKAAFKLK